jgi:quercetin dioxygenase-like cupin family protein
MRRIVFVLVAVIALAGVVASMVPASGQADKRTRDDLAGKLARREVQRSPLSIPNREMVQVETLIPAGVESGWHIHPGEEVGYIIAGQVEMRVQGRATVLLNPGDGFLIPRGPLIMRATSAQKPGGCCRLISSRQASRSLRSWTNPFSDRAKHRRRE